MLAQGIKNLMDRHGRTMTLTRKLSGGTYSTTTGTVSGGSTVNTTIRGVFVKYREDEIGQSMSSEDSRTMILRDDRKLLVQALGLTTTPQRGDFIDSSAVTILNVRKFETGGVIVAYECQVRG
jgi:hypothetical protein